MLAVERVAARELKQVHGFHNDVAVYTRTGFHHLGAVTFRASTNQTLALGRRSSLERSVSRQYMQALSHPVLIVLGDDLRL